MRSAHAWELGRGPARPRSGQRACADGEPGAGSPRGGPWRRGLSLLSRGVVFLRRRDRPLCRCVRGKLRQFAGVGRRGSGPSNLPGFVSGSPNPVVPWRPPLLWLEKEAEVEGALVWVSQGFCFYSLSWVGEVGTCKQFQTVLNVPVPGKRGDANVWGDWNLGYVENTMIRCGSPE